MILFIDCCVRKDSRTRRLAKRLLSHLNGEVEKVYLPEASLPPVDEGRIAQRGEAAQSGDFSGPVYDLPKQLRRADTLVIAAPYWDLSFPALLKRYLENVCVSGLTFFYNRDNQPESLCQLRRVYYVTTAGGPIFNQEYGYGYIKAITGLFFGAKEFACFSAEHLDEYGSDPERLLQEAEKRIDQAFSKSISSK